MAEKLITIGNDIDGLQKYLHYCHSFLNAFKWLSDSFVLDFFTEHHWNKLPHSWAEALESLTLEELAKFIQPNSHDKLKRNKDVLPLSLQAFKASCNSLSLNRTALTNLGQVIKYLNELGLKCPKDQQTCDWICPDGVVKPTGALGNLRNIFHKHVKPKKQHELYRMGQCCAAISSATGCKTVVDVGAGVGHLARFLSYGHGLKLVCLESVEKFGSAATQLDSQLENACKHLGISEFESPKHITLTLSPNSNNLFELLKPTIQDTTTIGLIGLHTCGDLGPTLIRNFAAENYIRFILVIGCCYMKMTIDGASSARGYPMSNFVGEKLQPSFISYEALEVACHALESYCDRLNDLELEKLKVHCYRATLETLLVKLESPLRHAGLRSVKNAHTMPFDEYAHKALDKMNVTLDLSELSSQQVQLCLEQWRRVVIFYSLRLMIAPVIESYVQMDRLLYLAEQGWSGCILPLFDCHLSPRNFALLCVKPEQLQQNV